MLGYQLSEKHISENNRHLKEDKKGATQVTPFINETSNKLSINQTKCTFMEENNISKKNKLNYICLKT